MKVTAVIPAFNASATIGDVVVRCRATGVLDQIVVIDDGSTDGTAENASGAGALVLEHGSNRGKGAALRTGFEYAVKHEFDAVVTLDADGQHEPESVPDFLEKHKTTGLQVIVGNRMFDPAGMPWLRHATNRTTSRIISIFAGQPIKDSQCGFRFYTAHVLTSVHLEKDRFDAESEILLEASDAGFEIGSVPVRSIYAGERSFIKPWRDTIRFVRLVAGAGRRNPG